MQQAARAVGLMLSGEAFQADAASLRDADLVLAMDRTNLGHLRRLAEVERINTPIVLFRSFDPEADGDLDVPDPYGGGPDGFADVVAICRRTAVQVIGQLDELLGGA